MTITYRTKDLFTAVNGDDDALIVHITNNAGQWGAGFVIPLAQRYPRTKQIYDSHDSSLELGRVCFIEAEEDSSLFVANMCAQDNVNTTDGRRVNYGALVTCMQKVKTYCENYNITEIHAPLFGSGLAGGDWDIIEELMEYIWDDLDVTIYQLPGQELRPSNA